VLWRCCGDRGGPDDAAAMVAIDPADAAAADAAAAFAAARTPAERVEALRRRAEAATLIQATWQMKVAREEYRMMRIHIVAATELQRAYRGHLGRKKATRRRPSMPRYAFCTFVADEPSTSSRVIASWIFRTRCRPR